MGIGPSTKETTLHHFRDPLLEVVSNDQDIDLLGVLVVGTPQGNMEKHYVGKRAAVWAEVMRADGVIISSDGWGNSHVDYANTIEEIGKRNIPLVGITFNGIQGKFVVTNEYMDTIVDINKSKEGIETEVVGENNVNELDCKKALAFLKLKMRGERK
ncbi:glycine/sarcosine/betaine reductase component B subunit [Crassaminicella indica]|uniref:Glycine/sarcosine/betaine reductase component B subunit n=1 Tax=Crassaminicella indica TaxID=2855394 RepID=A0ABX8R916_9CLOT|nr:glycine/sarcosine/betaine reductase component B subunit [Crassaminicella indica]QXM05539.1 glycine/sarcosine/betaine reductase component B subunit [Crassaminicella indica]